MSGKRLRESSEAGLACEEEALGRALSRALVAPLPVLLLSFMYSISDNIWKCTVKGMVKGIRVAITLQLLQIINPTPNMVND